MKSPAKYLVAIFVMLLAASCSSFFDDLRSMERRILTERGDTEALAILDAEDAEANAEDDADDE